MYWNPVSKVWRSGGDIFLCVIHSKVHERTKIARRLETDLTRGGLIHDIDDSDFKESVTLKDKIM